MAEKVEEIAELLETLKNESELNAEGLNNLLLDIKLKLENISGDSVEISSVIENLKNTLQSKITGDEQKLVVISDKLSLIADELENSNLPVQIDTLSLNFKDAVDSIVKFANQDTTSKNILFDKITALEDAVKNNEVLEVVRVKYNDLIHSFEIFTSDANLRNANIISAMADLTHIIEENSSKNLYMLNSLSGSINENTEKLNALDGTVSSQFGTVNSKLFSLGDDIQNTLQDGFEHLKYLIANLSDHMNSSSIDMKTSLECIRANLSDYSEQLKAGLEHFNADFGQKIGDCSNIQTKNSQLILNDLKTLSSKFDEQSKEYENNLNTGMSKLYEFLTVYKDAVLSISDENKEILAAKFSTFESALNASYNEYKDITDNMRIKLEDAAALIRETADSAVLGVVNSNSEIINELKNDLLSTSEQNLDSIISKIDENANNITEFKNSVADNLSGYLTSIKDLFVEYSDNVNSAMKNNEVIEKLTKVEELISKSSAERNTNFDFVMSGLETSKETVQNLAEIVKNAHSEQTESLNEIKTLIETNSDAERTISHLENVINEHSADKNEKIDSLRTILESYKNSVDKLTDDIAVQNGNTTFDLSVLKKFTHEVLPKFNNLKKLEEIISEKSSGFKEVLDVEVKEIQASIAEIAKTVSELPVNDNSEIVKKLIDFEMQLNDASQTYEINLESLKVALAQYAQNSDKIFAETDTKFQNSIAEVQKIQSNFDMLAGKMATLIGDSGLIEILANIRQQFNIVLTQLKNDRDGIVSELNESLNDGISSISSNLYLIGQNLEEVRVKQSENAEYLRGNFEEKMLGLQADIERTISDIKNIVEFKSGSILEEFQPVKDALTAFTDFDYEQIVSDVKNQIEVSYVNLSETLNSAIERGVSTEFIDKLYKDAILKLTEFEQHVQEMSKNNFDIITQALTNISTMVQGTFTVTENVQNILENDLKRIENNILENRESVKSSLVELLENIKNFINEKRNAETNELRNEFLPLLDNEEVFNLIRGLNKNVADKIEEFKQDHTLASQDIIDIINSVNNTVDYTLDVINEKFETSSNTDRELLQKVDALNSKLDIIAMSEDSDLYDSIDELGDTVLSVKNTLEEVSGLVSQINNNTVSGNSIIPAIRMSVEKIRETLTEAGDKLKINNDYEPLLREISEKLDKFNSQDTLNTNIENVFKVIDNKLDIIAQDNNSEYEADLDDIRQILSTIEEKIDSSSVKDLIHTIDNKIDVIVQDNNAEIESDIDEIKHCLSEIQGSVESSEITNLLNRLDNKLDIIAQSDNVEIVESLEQVNRQIGALQDDIHSASDSDSKLEDLINTLHNKVDVIAMSDDSNVQDEISEIRDLIEEQISNNNTNYVNESLQRLLTKISEIDLSKQAGEIKESVISALVAVTNDISFVEETEEIKDFVSEKTNELHRTMMDVKHQLSTLTNSGDDMDFYSYTLQDVESDLAKVRLILKDMSGEFSANEICVISNNILKISKNLEDLQAAFYEAEARRLSNVDITEQVVSISSRINQLLLNMNEATGKLEKIDTSDVTKGIEKVLVSMDEKLAYSNNLNTILKNVMMYLGEWMDGTTETISSIYDKAAKVNSVAAAIEELKKSVPDKHELITALENKFNEQDFKIKRLEEQLTRISTMVSTRNDSAMLDRIDSIDSRLQRLSENIEKLASYVE